MFKLIGSFSDFEPWSYACDFWNELERSDLLDELEWQLEEIFPEGLTFTELNDLLWHDEEIVREWLGIEEEEEEEEEI